MLEGSRDQEGPPIPVVPSGLRRDAPNWILGRQVPVFVVGRGVHLRRRCRARVSRRTRGGPDTAIVVRVPQSKEVSRAVRGQLRTLRRDALLLVASRPGPP